MRYFWVLQRGATTEDMKEGSVPGRLHRVLLGYNWKEQNISVLGVIIL